jgi:hypothetical protein
VATTAGALGAGSGKADGGVISDGVVGAITACGSTAGGINGATRSPGAGAPGRGAYSVEFDWAIASAPPAQAKTVANNAAIVQRFALNFTNILQSF